MPSRVRSGKHLQVRCTARKASLADAHFLYALSVVRQGNQAQSDMDETLAALSRGVIVKEK